MATKDARSLPAVAQADLRRKAVAAVRDGKTQVEVARLFGVTRQSVAKWVQRHEEGGATALKAKRRGRPRGGSLEPWQAAQIVRTIEDRVPEQLKLPYFLWTREAVKELIAIRTGKDLSVWTVGRYLARWGFTPQKPVRRAYERNPEAVRRWLQDEYPAIQSEAKRLRATILWEDEMGLRSDHAAGRSYGRRGQTPVIPGTGQRFGCNMLSAISNRGRLFFQVFKGKFRAPLFVAFLRRLLKQLRGRIFLIVDGHPVHRAAHVKRFLKSVAPRLQLYFLPAYSPDLNPDELLNQDVKSNALGRQRPLTQRDMMIDVRGFLWSRQRRPHLVRRYFHGKHVRYAA